jgi:thioredoxin
MVSSMNINNMITYLKEEKLEDLTKEGTIIVDFYADWCGPCRSLAVELEKLVEENNDIKIVKIDVDAHEEIARAHKVMSIPTILLYSNGEIIKKQVGTLDKDELISWITISE